MLSVSHAEKIILDLVQSLDGQRDAEVVTLLTAIERILAAPVVSQLDFPTGTIPQWMDTYVMKT